jgi:putative hydroxymethylpyrimidine transport system substrate-binding protein
MVGKVMRRSRLAIAAATLLAVVILAAGCGDESTAGTEPFDLALDFYVNPDHVGIYEALDEGFFEDAGLEVHPHVPSDPSAPVKQVASGQVDLAVSYEPEVILARDQGLDVVAVAALVDGPLTSVISLPDSGIQAPADLAGKTVVTAGIPYQTAYLQTILRKAGVDPASVDQVDVGFNLLQPLLAGRADAMLGGFLNVEGVDLAERGEDPTVMPVDQLGIPTYDELVLVADADRVRDDPGPIRDFIAALAEGTADARNDPAGATDALLVAAPDLDPDLTKAEVAKTLPLLGPEKGKPYGYMDPAEWEHFARFLADQGQIDAAPPADEMLDDGLLPKG